MALNIENIRTLFPALHQEVNNRPLVYFDNAATSQKPQMVIDAISNYYSKENSNIHRGVHFLSQQATSKYEAAREAVRRFINARSIEEIIFTRGTTEAINLVSSCLARSLFKEGDEIIGKVKILKKTKTLIFLFCELKCDNKIITSATGVWKILKIKPSNLGPGG